MDDTRNTSDPTEKRCQIWNEQRAMKAEIDQEK